MKALVLSSGGVDSTTALGLAVKKFGKENVIALSVSYGQKHTKEIEAAKKVAAFYGVEQLFMDLSKIFQYSNCSLLQQSTEEIPEESYKEQIEKTKDRYYDTLEESDVGWHEEENDTTPFIRYMLQIILACYTEFEERVGMMTENGNGSTAYDIVRKYTKGKIGRFTGADVVAHCPSIGRSSALAALKKLTEEGLIIREGSGRSTFYIRADSK